MHGVELSFTPRDIFFVCALKNHWECCRDDGNEEVEVAIRELLPMYESDFCSD